MDILKVLHGSIVNKYQNIENLGNDDIKFYVESLKKILKEERPEILRKIFSTCEEIEFIDEAKIEGALKREYAKKLNEGLFTINEAQKTTEEGIYEAGTEFKMIIHSVGAFYLNKNQNENFQENWNKRQITSAHFCTSYISNDMIATAPIKNFCYGFTNMQDDSLVLAGATDIFSDYEFSPKSQGDYEVYFLPDELIGHTLGYNELDYLRYQNGTKKQPDYIVVFKEDGIVQNLELAKQAAKDWGGMPIVIVDKDKCLESEKTKVDQMLLEYDKTQDPRLAREIWQKVRNNRQTKGSFCPQINLEELKKKFEQKKQEVEESKESPEPEKSKETQEPEEKTKVTQEELRQAYEETLPQERLEETRKFRQIYESIHEITNQRTNPEKEGEHR